MKSLLLKLCVAAMLVISLPALAADKEAPAAAEKSDKPATADKTAAKENPFRAEISAMARELAKEYSKEQALALAQIRNGFGMIRAVRLVKNDVDHAVKACGKDNPDMNADMTVRFEKWSASVDPLLKKNSGDMDAAIDAGTFPDKKKVKAYLDLIDKAAKYADSQITKNVVTTPEACSGLMKSMDETEPTMINLLQSIVWVPAAPATSPAPDSGGEGEKE